MEFSDSLSSMKEFCSCVIFDGVKFFKFQENFASLKNRSKSDFYPLSFRFITRQIIYFSPFCAKFVISRDFFSTSDFNILHGIRE